MGLKTYKPTSPGIRFVTTLDKEELTVKNKRPENSLIVSYKKKAGRDHGQISARHRGGGHKRFYRIIDFKRDKDGVPAVVNSIEYDPNRSCNIALLHYKDGEKRYILAPLELKTGAVVESGSNVEVRSGNALPIKDIPVGLMVHNVELVPGQGGKLGRSAGAAVQLLSKEGKYAHVKLPSGEIRLVNSFCRATVGQLGNIDHENVTIGKAGRVRHMGWRPKVRGVAMNPIDHPHGGGEGKSSAGHMLTTPWGQPTKGYKTRRNKKTTRFIVSKKKK